MSNPNPIEPWLRGPVPGVHRLLAPLIYSLQHAREDLEKWTEGLTDDQVWARPLGLAPIGFQIRHIGGSVERLMVYVTGGQLTDEQLAEVSAQMDPGESLAQVLARCNERLSAAEAKVRQIDPATLSQPREVGRKRLPTTVGGLLTHIAEHMQRHVGEAIVTARVLRATQS